jgi:hypothetical protein
LNIQVLPFTFHSGPWSIILFDLSMFLATINLNFWSLVSRLGLEIMVSIDVTIFSLLFFTKFAYYRFFIHTFLIHFAKIYERFKIYQF